jgi:hypothetical protein
MALATEDSVWGNVFSVPQKNQESRETLHHRIRSRTLMKMPSPSADKGVVVKIAPGAGIRTAPWRDLP